MSAALKVQLLGEFALWIDGDPYPAIDTARLRTLLAFLVMKRGTALSRSRLAFQFWPESTEKQAKTNFRHLLHELRKALPDADTLIDANAKTIEWKSDANLELDVDLFEEADSEAQLACKRGDLAVASVAFEKAVALYGGELLPGHYDEWVVEERERLRQLYGESLQSSVACFEGKRSYQEAIQYCQKLRQFEPTREKTYADLMRLYSLSGDRAKALQVYGDCEKVLRKELDVSTSERTNELYRKLLSEEPLELEGKAPASIGVEPELPLQGRQAEWQQLKTAWANALSGQSQLIVLIGEAGIGKSRLAEELYVSLARQGIAACRTRSYSAEGRLAYAPVCQWMRSPVLYPALERLEPVWQAEIARVMPELRVKFPDLPESSIEQGNWQRHLLFEALSRAVLAKGEPVFFLLDDMQWTDQESLEWLRFMLRFAPAEKFLIVGTIREEELTQEHPLRRLMLDLSRDGQICQIQLGPISSEDAAEIAAGVAGHKLSTREVARLYQTTEGNPLFVVESVRAGLRNRPATSLDSYEGLELSTTLPPKVHSVFATRLAQLSSPSLELSRIAAVFGRAFTIEMLVDVSGKPEEEIIDLLEELWEKRIIREQEAGVYDFTHDKLREVTYEQISTPKRRMLHRKSSDVLEKFFATDLNVVMAQLGSHYEEAGQVSKAIDAYRKAAIAAKELNASREAIRLFGKALGILSGLPTSKERLELELDLNTDLGTCQVSEYGYHAPGVQRLYERSQEICSQLDRSTTPPVLRALALYNLTTGRLHKTLEIARELEKCFEETKDNVLYVEYKYVLGVAHFWLGEFSVATDNLLSSIGRYDERNLQEHLALYAQDPQAICICRLAWCYYVKGYSDKAIESVRKSFRLARTLKHPHTEGYVLYFGAQVCVNVGDFELATEMLDSFDAVKAEHQLAFWAVRGEMLRGYMGVLRDRDRESMKRFEENFANCVAIKPTISLSLFLVYYAELHALMGDSEKALEVLETFRSAAGESDESFYQSELLRQKAELLMYSKGGDVEAEQLFSEALDLARMQGALAFELKASLGLAKLWRGQEKTKEALKLLEGVYQRYEEGFEREEMILAKSLLDAWK